MVRGGPEPVRRNAPEMPMSDPPTLQDLNLDGDEIAQRLDWGWEDAAWDLDFRFQMSYFRFTFSGMASTGSEESPCD
jgi:hypothetical protein